MISQTTINEHYSCEAWLWRNGRDVIVQRVVTSSTTAYFTALRFNPRDLSGHIFVIFHAWTAPAGFWRFSISRALDRLGQIIIARCEVSIGMAAAGIYSDRGVEKKGKGRQFKTLSFHSLRHTFVSELANADVPADVRRQISGHNDEKIHERYTHLDVDTKRRALAHLRPLHEPSE